jgi:hypothetical protein
MNPSKINVLVNCEESGTVREEFRKLGFNAWSCDLVPSRIPGNHLQMDAVDAISYRYWDLMIAHPPCTFLANSGAKHLYVGMKKENGVDSTRWRKMQKAAQFFKNLLESDVPFIAVENPIMLGHAVKIIEQKSTQTIQPYMFGHMEQKATCLWLRNLPKLVKTCDVYDEMMLLPKRERERVHHMPPGENRQRDRSVTYKGIARAMADQWGRYLVENL